MHFQSLRESLEFLERNSDIETCWIIGGSSVYQESMNLPGCSRIYLTHIDQEFDCDAFFPPIDSEKFVELSGDIGGLDMSVQSEGDITYHYKVFERKVES